MHCFRANTWYRSENPRAVCVFVSPVLIPSSTNRRVDHFHPTRYLSHLPAGIFYWNLFSRILSLLIRPLNFTQNDLSATSNKNTNFNISKNLLRKVGISNSLCSAEQFSSLFSKDKLKQGAHIHQTHDPPSPRMSLERCRVVPSQQLPHVLCGTGI